MPVYRFEFDPYLLDSFMAVAEAGSMLRGAGAVGLSQPAVSAQVKKLESALGVALFRRSTSGAALTEAGQAFREQARRVYAVLAEAVAGASSSQAVTGHLEIVASTTASDHVLPKILCRFRARHPGVSLRLRSANSDEVVRAVRSGEAALGMVEGVSKAHSVRLERYLDDELVPVVSAKSDARPLRLSDALRLPILWREDGSGSREAVVQALAKAGVPRSKLSFVVVMGSTEAIKSAVTEGHGMAFLSRWSLQNELLLGTLRVLSLPGLNVPRAFQWVRASGALDALTRSFHAFALAQRPTPAL